MATTVVNKSQAVKDKDGYAGYTFRLEVIMNSYNSSVPSYNVTINHYAKGDNATNHKYNGLTTPKSVIKGVAGSTTYGNVTTTVSKITGSETLVATWTGDIQANASGDLNITYSASYNANKSSGYLPATHTISETVNMPTIPRYATITSFNVNQRDETSLNVTWGANVTCDYAWYRIRQSGGSYGNWVGGVGTNFNITGLTPNTTYVVQLRVRRQDSQLTTDSGETRNTTYDYPKVTSAPNFIVGNTNTITISNPLHRSCAIYIINPLGTEKGGDTTTDETVSGYVTASWQSFFYNGIPNSTSGLYRVRLVCSEISRDTTVDGGTYSINTNDNKPTFDNFVSQYTANLTTLTNNNQTVINNLSTVTYRITTGATAKNGASISKYVVQWGSISREITDIVNSVSLPKGSGNSLTVTVYDSRNLTTTTSVPFSDYIDYFLPKEIVVNTHRRNGVEETTYGDITGKLYYDTFGTNGEHNALSSITYSVVDGGTDMPYDISTVTYSEQDLTKHEQVFTIKNVIINENTGIQGFDTDKAYTISFKVIDLTGQIVTITGEIKSGKFALTKMCDSNGDYHLGMNTIPDEDCTLKVNGKIKSESTFYSSTEINEDYKMNVLKTKNLMNIKTIYSTTKNGVTYSINDEGTIKLNGTCTGQFDIDYINELLKTEANKTYTLRYIYVSGSMNGSIMIANEDSNYAWTGWDLTLDSSSSSQSQNLTNTYATNRNCVKWGSLIRIYGSSVFDNLTFKLMFVETNNLFNTSNIVSGYGLNTDGSTYAQAEGNRSYLDYTEVNSATNYKIGKLTWKVIQFFDENEEFISGSGTTSSNTFTTPTNCKYIRISFDNTVSWKTGLIINDDDLMAQSYEPYVKHRMSIDNETYSETVKIGTNVDSRSRVNILKSNNILNYTIPNSTNIGVTRSMSGSEILLNGTSSGEGSIYYNNSNTFKLKAGTYNFIATKLNGSFTKTTQAAAIYVKNASTNAVIFQVTSGAQYNFERTQTITISADTNCYIQIYCNASGMVFNNLKLGLAVIPDTNINNYEPYVVPSINVDGEDYKLDSHPIGDVVIRWDETSPALLFGGTWELTATDRFIIGAGNTYALNSTGGSSTVSLAHYHRPSDMYANIGSPYGNANALGFSATGWHGTTSTYSVGGNTASASGHPNRSHDTTLGGTTDTRLGSTDITPPYIAFYIWKRIG